MIKTLKRVSIIILATALLASCDTNPACETSAYQSTDSTSDNTLNSQSVINQNAENWESFVTRMQQQGVDYDSIHTLESSGYLREDIMKMTANEIIDKIKSIREIIVQNKIDLLKEIFANPESVKEDEQFVYTAGATERIDLVKQCLGDIQENEWGSFTGYMAGGTVPISYELSYMPDGEGTLILYSDNLGLKEYIVTDIYEHSLFYHFTDNKDLYFSIPKTDYVFTSKTPIEGYIAGENLECNNNTSNPLTAQQAINTARETGAAMVAYHESINRHNINCYGEVVPETFRTDTDTTRPAKIVDAALIDDARYYKVAIFQNQEGMSAQDIYTVPVDVYYVSANDNIVFLENMVAGALIPIGYKGVKHFQLS